MYALSRSTAVEAKLFMREPLTVAFTLALPLLFLFVMGGVFGNKADPQYYRGAGALDYYVPAYCGLVWTAVGIAAVFLLTRTTFGRTVYAIGNRERAAYLSGARTRLVVMAAFALSGALSAFGGVLLAGYASKAAQAMGDPYLLPAIAAVVLGGTSILGGRGSYLGTVAGVILITLLQSILSVMQMEEFGRHVTYGVVIIAMLLIYGRGKRYSE